MIIILRQKLFPISFPIETSIFLEHFFSLDQTTGRVRRNAAEEARWRDSTSFGLRIADFFGSFQLLLKNCLSSRSYLFLLQVQR